MLPSCPWITRSGGTHTPETVDDVEAVASDLSYPVVVKPRSRTDWDDDRRMYRSAGRVIAAFGWTGPAQVEFVQRPDGGCVRIEVDGRYWGSRPFANNYCVDFPCVHWRQVRGESVRHDGDYRTDVIQRRTRQDLEWLGHRLADGDYRSLGPFLADFVRAEHTFVEERTRRSATSDGSKNAGEPG